MRRGAAMIACASALVMLPARANAVTDLDTGFALDIDTSGACVLVPLVADSGPTCATTDVPATVAKLERSSDPVLFAARVDHGDWAYLVVVSHRPGAGEIDDAELRGLGSALRESNQSATVEVRQPTPATTVTRANDVQIVTAPLSLTVTNGENVAHERVVSHFISGAGRYVLTTLGDEAHAKDVDAMAERILATVKMDPPLERAANATPLASSVTYFRNGVIGIVLLIAAAVIVRRLARAA